jgi:ATP-dependent DNA helicase UvrD/PcrA
MPGTAGLEPVVVLIPAARVDAPILLERMFDSGSVELNRSQRDVVEHDHGPLLVVAGAGTGKTWTLACRLARLIERGTPADRILLLTFTRRAAREMLSRAERLLSGPGTGERAGGRVWGGTFHAVANRLLRLHGGLIGVRPDFTILDQADAADMLNLVRSDLGVADGERRFPKKETLASIYSRTVNARRRLPEVVTAEFPWCRGDVNAVASIFRTYTERKRRANVLDFDDLLLFWHALARRAGDRLGAMFDHVLVDEYQDTNALQAEILVAMRQENRDIMVVGDDAQAIYAFRSATVRNILEFPQRFPGTRIVKLEDNYRSTQPILDASNRVIALARERHEKELSATRAGERRPVLRTCDDETSQSDAVCREVLGLREAGTTLHEQAVLFRAAHHSDLLEVELSRRNIPFVKFGGLRFLESAHVRDALAVMRLLENPHDEIAWFRVLQMLEGVGPATARRAMVSLGVQGSGGAVAAGVAAADAAGTSPVRRLIDGPPSVPAMLGADARSLRETLSECLDAEIPPAAELERVRLFLAPILTRRYDGAEARLRDLEQLEALAGEGGSGTGERARFLADLTLDPPSSTEELAGPPGLDDDYLILSTIHSAKGGEWDAVHVIHAADGNIPSDLATGTADGVEEERRLFYVALTRARNVLNVYFPLRYHRRPRGLDDAHGYAQLTRFLAPSVLESFDRVGTEPFGSNSRVANGDGTERASLEVPAVDALLEDLWSTTAQ